MKVLYSISALNNVGGMERILTQKANYLADTVGYDVVIVTTEQLGKKPYFPLSSRVRIIDLNVNYGEESNRRNPILKMIWKGLHKPEHKRKIKKVIYNEKPDIVITLFNKDIGFLPSIKDGSKKIAEFHFSHNYKITEARNFLLKLSQKIRMNIWRRELLKFDKFVVLTQEDKLLWGNMPNIVVIPNFIPQMPSIASNIETKRVIAVGRISYQKGFDLLVKAWDLVNKELPSWNLDIFGKEEKIGEQRTLQELIDNLGLSDKIHLNAPVKNIGAEYCKSSIFVLSSRYEGLPMVILEALSYGLPVISFECECGPKDIINNTVGELVRNGDVKKLARVLIKNMKDFRGLKEKGANAKDLAQNYTADNVMQKWVSLFQTLKNKD